jgi:hypothetical protein
VVCSSEVQLLRGLWGFLTCMNEVHNLAFQVQSFAVGLTYIQASSRSGQACSWPLHAIKGFSTDVVEYVLQQWFLPQEAAFPFVGNRVDCQSSHLNSNVST